MLCKTFNNNYLVRILYRNEKMNRYTAKLIILIYSKLRSHHKTNAGSSNTFLFISKIIGIT